jgi:CAAX protease family protein
MLTPALSALIVFTVVERRSPWRRQVRSSILGRPRWYIVVWAMAVAVALLTIALTILIHPTLLRAGASIRTALSKALPGPLWMQLSLLAISDLLLAPVLNLPIGLGEEVGWRGFLYPRLAAVMPLRWALLVGGVIWGSWHAPMIVLTGLNYPNARISGVFFFCLITIPLGALLYSLYRRSRSIVVTAFGHLPVNWTASMTFFFISSDRINPFLDGMTGICAVLVLWFTAAIVMRSEGAGVYDARVTSG